MDHVTEGDDGHVAARTLDRGGTERHEVIGRNILLAVCEAHALEAEHRIVVADRGLQQALRVRRTGGEDHLQPGDVGEDRVRALRVLSRELQPAAVQRPDDDREVPLAAEHVADLRSLVHDLIERDEAERHVAPEHHWP